MKDNLYISPLVGGEVKSLTLLSKFFKIIFDSFTNFSIFRLNPKENESKNMYGVCCGSENFQKYLKDVNRLDIVLSMLNSSKRSASPNAQLKFFGIPPNYKPIGKCSLNNIRLTARNEFVSESTIFSYDKKDPMGSVMVYMLYQPGVIKPSADSKFFNESNSDFASKERNKSLDTKESDYFSGFLDRSISDEEKSSATDQTLMEKLFQYVGMFIVKRMK